MASKLSIFWSREVRKASKKKCKKKKTASGRKQSDSVKAFVLASKYIKSQYRA